MGLKFERSNDLDKLFDSFAVDPLKNCLLYTSDAADE